MRRVGTWCLLASGVAIAFSWPQLRELGGLVPTKSALTEPAGRWPDGDSTAAATPSAAGARTRLGPAAGRIAPSATGAAVPESLRGTDADGALHVDEHGHFVPRPEAIELFDYFLAATGELPEDELVSLIAAEIHARLDGPAVAEALALLEGYLDYRGRSAEIVGELDATATPEERIERLAELRTEIFGEDVAAALFFEEEQLARVLLARREIAADRTLSAEEKKRALADLEAELPVSVREARSRALGPAVLARDEARMRAEGASPEQVRELRERRYGSDAADRLERLERDRARWASRVEAFRGERARIEGDASLTAEQRRRAVADLLEREFDEPERLRLRAMDRIAGR